MKQLFFLIFCLLLSQSSLSQKNKKDSLVAKLSEVKEDSSKVKIFNELGVLLFSKNPEEARNYCEQALHLAQKSNYKKGFVSSTRILGTIAYLNNEFLKAKDLYTESLNASIELRDTLTMANSYRNVALAYNKLLQENHSVEYFLKSLNLFLNLKDTARISTIYNDLGNAFYTQKDFKSAISYYRKALELFNAKKDQQGTAMALNNIGSVHSESNSFDSGYQYFKQSFAIREQIGDLAGMLTTYSNFGDIYLKRKEFDKALRNDLAALKIARQTGSNDFICRVMNDLATDHIGLENFSTALRYADTSLALARSERSALYLQNAHLSLYEIYSKTGQSELALENYKNYILFRDSLSNSETFKKITQSEMQFLYEKDKEKLKLEQEKKDAVNKEILEKQTILRNSFIAGFIFLLILVFIVYRGYRIKQKSNIEVSKQKQLVEEKQKEILDSIHYARRIQQSLMTSEKYIDKYINKLKNNNK